MNFCFVFQIEAGVKNILSYYKYITLFLELQDIDIEDIFGDKIKPTVSFFPLWTYSIRPIKRAWPNKRTGPIFHG